MMSIHPMFILFVGDSHVVLISASDNYEQGFINALRRIAHKNVKAIYFGHGDTLLKDCNSKIRLSLKMVEETRKAGSG